MTYEEAQRLLEDMLDDLPQEIFKDLSGGVSLLTDCEYDENGLLVLGRYHFDPYGLGRYITINYGSLMEYYGNQARSKFAKKLKDVLHHELTHHIEHMAGDKTLERKDAEDIRRYINPSKKRNSE